MKTFVYIDHFKGEVQPASWEAIGLAKKYGTAVALVFGADTDEITKAAFEYGADEVIGVDDAAHQWRANAERKRGGGDPRPARGRLGRQRCGEQHHGEVTTNQVTL